MFVPSRSFGDRTRTASLVSGGAVAASCALVRVSPGDVRGRSSLENESQI
jgi:hypothetical protein